MFDVRILNKEELREVIELQNVIGSVESVYKQKSLDRTVVWPTVFYEFNPGVADMDIRSGYLKDDKIFGHKTIAFFDENRQKNMPALMGMINVFDAEDGHLMGILDGAYITGLRTGAAGAIGAKCFARKNSENLMLMGAGNQATYQVAATLTVIPTIRKVQIVDPVNPENGKNFASEIAGVLKKDFDINCDGIEFEATDDIETAVGSSDIIITVTPSRKPLIKADWVKPGTHFSCIGSDMEGKEEISPEIVANAKIYVDDKPHCIEAGEIEIPIKEKYISESNIMGEIGDYITGKIAGRTNDDEITLFDATGMALLDLATAKSALMLAEEKNLGTVVKL